MAGAASLNESDIAEALQAVFVLPIGTLEFFRKYALLILRFSLSNLSHVPSYYVSLILSWYHTLFYAEIIYSRPRLLAHSSRMASLAFILTF